MEKRHIRIRGIVQGVGFRPFIYRLAQEHHLGGWVYNDSEGVLVEIAGPTESLKAFQEDILKKAPAASVIDSIEPLDVTETQDVQPFKILQSPLGDEHETLISPDLAICDECKREIIDENDRRHGYAFTNCTNCGPRYSIIEDTPYDRPYTTMKDFKMCPDCQHEYENPLDRRFHAQPNACEKCGPEYLYVESEFVDKLRERDRRRFSLQGKEALESAVRAIKQSQIVAIKGIGGYHLACDATDDYACRKLRSRKHREDKPFAVMCGSIERAKELCEISPEEQQLLESRTAPIVLLRKKPEADKVLAEAVAPGNPWLGVMLPYAPVHVLMLKNNDVWVMTSANRSQEPIAYKDEDAFTQLSGIADAFLTNNREIAHRVDDSVTRVLDEEPYIIRRSRGYAPSPIMLGKELEKAPEVLACGAELKNTFCVTKGRKAFVSEHIGDLENQPVLNSYAETISHYERIFSTKPKIIAVDMHPDYMSSNYGRDRAEAEGIPLIELQHHYSHIASVLAEHGVTRPVLGAAFDGTGYGDDGNIWGGEFLLADLTGYKRMAQFEYVPLPGGNKAAREPWRQALWVLAELYCGVRQGESISKEKLHTIETVLKAKFPKFMESLPKGWQMLLQATASRLNAPLSSSVGRLFDTAAAILGVRNVNNYEGQAAVELELLARQAGEKQGVVPFYVKNQDDMLRVNFMPVMKILAEAENKADGAMVFHNTLAEATVLVFRELRNKTGIRTVALSGGVFQNRLLLELLLPRLKNEGFTVLLNRQVPPNDGGLSLGQAAVAKYRMKK